ncbi:MAG: acyl--CoA ligase [Burkholderiales bacterium]|nr:acyl--CoA ligase [Burkholderiales bacterium]
MSTILTLHDPQIARGYYAKGWWREDTLYSLLKRHARERPRDYALRDSQRRLSWGQLLHWVDALAAELHAAGVKAGQRVSVWLPNRTEAVVIFLACSRNGYVCNPSLHQNYTAEEIVHLLDRIQTCVLFAQPGYGADADRNDIFQRAQALGSIKRVYRLDTSGGFAGSLPGAHAFPSPEAPIADTLALPELNPDKIVYLAFTSGTTGLPKGVLHSDNTLLANGRAMVGDWGHDHRTILYSHSPLSHHIGTVAIEQALVAGCELVVNDPPPGKKPLDRIVETDATYVMGVPTHAIDILADMTARGMRTLGKVKLFYMAGSVIPPETAGAFLALGIKPQNIYGMTENGSHQYTLPDDDVTTITTTCGRAAPGYETRIFDQEKADVEVETGATGEIGTRGALLMLGYFNNQFATETSFNALGWFMSGDLGRLDDKGNLSIIGRKKDLIIRGGHNIYPSRIENLMLRHPAVVKVAAFPIADKRLGERVCLAVILRDGTELDAEGALEHLDREGLSKFDMPEFFLRMEDFPLTASGKILKRELVEWAKSGRIAPEPCRWVAAEKRSSRA